MINWVAENKEYCLSAQLMEMQTQACDRCHRRKTKCDRRVPRCSSCDKANTPCVHTDKLDLLPYPRAYIHSLESTISRLETENNNLTNQLKISRPSLADSSPECTPASSTADENNEPQGDDRPFSCGNTTMPSDGTRLTFKTPVRHRDSGPGGVPLAGIVYSLVGPGSLPYPQNNETQQNQNLQQSSTSIFMLPSREDATRAIGAYFYHWHLTFPLLCRPQFLRTVEQIYSETDFYSQSPFEAFLFDMVLGMGCTNFNKLDWPSASPETHYMRAISKLDKVLSMTGLIPLQAIIFLCQYSIFCSLRDTSANMWHLVGIAVRLCMEIGLHRRSKQEEESAQGLKGGMVLLEVEMKKRTFWCLYNLDRIISITLGRPVLLRDEDIDTTLPTALNIDSIPLEELKQGVVIYNVQRTSPFLHLISIRRLAGKILQNVHCTTENKNLSPEEKRNIQESLHRDLQVCRAGISNIDVLSLNDDQQTSSFRSKTWYEIPYHNALLLLYRPSPTFPHTGSFSDNVAENHLITLNNILSSSMAVIRLYAEMHLTRRLNYSWITLHAVFIAGLSYVYSISRIIKEAKRRRTSLPSSLEYTQIIDVTRTCSNVLVAINERWATARGSCEIFDHLSNAIIQDAVKAELGLQKSGVVPYSHRSDDIQSPVRLGQSSHHHEQDSVVNNFPHIYASAKTNDYVNQPSTADPFQSSIAENGFRQFYNSLQGEVPGNISDPAPVPSEVLMGFSQDWFAGDSMSSTQHPGPTDLMDLWEIMGLVPNTNQFQKIP